MKIADCKHLPRKFVGPRTNKCEECGETFNLRVCLVCGHVGCCDSDPGQHARKHAESSGHQLMALYPASMTLYGVMQIMIIWNLMKNII